MRLPVIDNLRFLVARTRFELVSALGGYESGISILSCYFISDPLSGFGPFKLPFAEDGITFLFKEFTINYFPGAIF